MNAKTTYLLLYGLHTVVKVSKFGFVPGISSFFTKKNRSSNDLSPQPH
jgi:hypothetical protein